MGYAMVEYGRDLTPEERKEKALNLAASWWGHWQWYVMRRPVIDNQRLLDEYHHHFLGAAAILHFAYDLTDGEIITYCKEHADWLLDDHALDVDIDTVHFSPWDYAKF